MSQQMKEVGRKIIEANECMKFLRKNISFKHDIVSVMPDSLRLDAKSNSFGSSKQEIRVFVTNFDNGSVSEWTVKKFYDKLEEIKAFMDTQNEGIDAGNDLDQDPFLNES
jgi:hypothetical protein